MPLHNFKIPRPLHLVPQNTDSSWNDKYVIYKCIDEDPDEEYQPYLRHGKDVTESQPPECTQHDKACDIDDTPCVP